MLEKFPFLFFEPSVVVAMLALEFMNEEESKSRGLFVAADDSFAETWFCSRGVSSLLTSYTGFSVSFILIGDWFGFDYSTGVDAIFVKFLMDT